MVVEAERERERLCVWKFSSSVWGPVERKRVRTHYICENWVLENGTVAWKRHTSRVLEEMKEARIEFMLKLERITDRPSNCVTAHRVRKELQHKLHTHIQMLTRVKWKDCSLTYTSFFFVKIAEATICTCMCIYTQTQQKHHRCQTRRKILPHSYTVTRSHALVMSVVVVEKNK